MYELKNHTESVVRQALQDYMRRTELPCKCQRCQVDILAMVLNRLPARYYVSLRGEILTHLETSSLPDQARVMAEIVRCCQHVATSPSHSPAENQPQWEE